MKTLFYPFLACLFLGFLVPRPGEAQSFSQSFPEWEEMLADTSDISGRRLILMASEIQLSDSARFDALVHEFARFRQPGGQYYGVRFGIWELHTRKRFVFHRGDQPAEVRQFLNQLEELVQKAYSSGDTRAIAQVSWFTASVYYSYNNLEQAAMYGRYAIEQLESLTTPDQLAEAYLTAGEIFFHARNYNKSLHYTLKGLEQDPRSARDVPIFLARYINTVGQAYQKLGMLDSAMFYFDKSRAVAESLHHAPWVGINACYEGEIQYGRGLWPEAEANLRFAYLSNRVEVPDIAARALTWHARVKMKRGQTDSALLFLRESRRLLQTTPELHHRLQAVVFLKDLYLANAEWSRMKNQGDSLFYFLQLHKELSDSIESVALLSSQRIAELSIANQQSRFEKQAMIQERKKEEQKRNLIIFALVLFAGGAILVLNRQKAVLKYRGELTQSQKLALEQQAKAAQSRLEEYTRSLLEKTQLLENLQQQISERSEGFIQDEILTELSQYTILTDDDWTRFKVLFEKIYPGFFMRIRQQAPGITMAEQRMAALSRLKYSTREMASMLGISVDSVHKTRQRLRNRLQLPPEVSLDDHLAGS